MAHARFQEQDDAFAPRCRTVHLVQIVVGNREPCLDQARADTCMFVRHDGRNNVSQGIHYHTIAFSSKS